VTRRVRLAFLGTPWIECDGVPAQLDTRKAVALLAYLAVGDGPASRESLVTLLWSRYGRAGGHAALRRTLSTIRSALGRDVLATERENVGLSAAEGLWVDILHFRQLTARSAAHAHGERGVCRDCLPILEEAARLLRGELLAGFTLKDSLDFDDWQFYATEKIRTQAAHLLDRLVTGKAALGEYGAAIGYALQRLGLDRLDEAAHASLMRLHAWDGNPAAARQQFNELRDLLATELDSDPQEETIRLAENISQGLLPRPPGLVPADGGSARLLAPATFATVLIMRAEALQTRTTEVIRKYHGRVAESSGTGFLAVFDDGRYVESNPELAVRAGLELRSVERNLRGAVATGGQADRLVPLARLLAERAPAGSLLSDELTYHLTREAFLFHSARPGRIGAFLVGGVAPVSRKSRGSANTLTEMVGREEETAKLSRAFEKAVTGKGQVVVITGEARCCSRLPH